MSSICENLENNQVKLTISVPPSQFDNAVNEVYNKQKGKIDISGFRKGKVPRQIVEKMYGEGYFYLDAINHILSDIYKEAIEEHSLSVVSRPEFDVDDMSKEKGAVVTAVVFIKPPVIIAKEDYLGIKYPKMPNIEVTEEEIKQEINKERDLNTRLIPTERAIMYGDVTTIDFEGFIDGLTFEGGSSSNYKLTIGSNTFIDNFEDQLVGKEVGDEFNVDVTFPSDYGAQQFAGKQAQFKVLVKEIFEKEVPELDDEFAQDVSEFNTFAEYEESIKVKIKTSKEDQQDKLKNNTILKLLAEKIEIDLPKAMVETEIDLSIQNIENNAKMSGRDFYEQLEISGETLESVRENLAPQAEVSVRIGLILDEIIKLEGYEATEEEIIKEITPIAERFGMTVDSYLQMAPKDMKGNFSHDVKRQKANKYLLENAIEDETQKLEEDN